VRLSWVSKASCEYCSALELHGKLQQVEVSLPLLGPDECAKPSQRRLHAQRLHTATKGDIGGVVKCSLAISVPRPRASALRGRRRPACIALTPVDRENHSGSRTYIPGAGSRRRGPGSGRCVGYSIGNACSWTRVAAAAVSAFADAPVRYRVVEMVSCREFEVACARVGGGAGTFAPLRDGS